MPALDQLIALPCASVMVTMVLLKLALTCATPLVMFLRSRRAFRPFVRLDVFPNTVRLLPPRIIGRAETFEQLPLPDVRAAVEWQYAPFEESA